MSRALSFGPEVAELVREIAARPDSVLFRAAPGAYASLDVDVMRATDTGLSSAERHLLAVYREEAAFALRDLAWARLANHTSGGDRLILTQTVSTSAPSPQPARAARSASRVLRETPRDALPEESCQLLEVGLGSADDSLRHVVQLCAASQRIAPTWNARMMTAQALKLDGRRSAGSAIATRALAFAPTATARSITWNEIAEIAAWDGRLHDAKVATIESRRTLPEYLNAQIAWILVALRQEAWSTALDGCRTLDEMVAATPGALDQFAERFAALAETYRAFLSPVSRRITREVVDRSPSAGRLFHAFVT